MNWEAIRKGLVDELEKISTFNLKGLSPETVLEKSQPPPPMETSGFNKARDILGMAAQTKTAAAKKGKDEKHIRRAFPTQPGLGKMVHQGDNSAPEQAKSVAGYGLAGLGTGGAVHRAYSSMPSVHSAMNHPELSAMQKYTAGAKVNRLGNKMMLGGAALGAGYGMYRAAKKSRLAKQGEITKTATPAQALKASQQVGKVHVKPSASGPSTTTQIRGQLIGKKGIP